MFGDDVYSRLDTPPPTWNVMTDRPSLNNDTYSVYSITGIF